MLFAKKSNQVNMIGHHNEHEQLYLTGGSQMVETVNNDPFDHISLKQMHAFDCCGSYKIEIIRIEVWFDRHNTSSLLTYAPAGFATLRLTRKGKLHMQTRRSQTASERTSYLLADFFSV